MRNLDKDTSTISRVGFTSACTAMAHAFEHGEPVAHYLVRLSSFNVCDESYAAGVLLEGCTV
jgi:hypothetical protein